MEQTELEKKAEEILKRIKFVADEETGYLSIVYDDEDVFPESRPDRLREPDLGVAKRAIKQLLQQENEARLREFADYIWYRDVDGTAHDEYVDDFLKSLSPKGNG